MSALADIGDRPIRTVDVSMRFDDGTKVSIRATGDFARRIIRAITADDTKEVPE